MKELEKLKEVLNRLQSQTNERMYDLVWVGKGYSKSNLLKDLREIEKESWN